MRLLLSQGTPAAAAAESVPVGDTQPLTTDQTLAVLKRLPALAALPGEQQAFRLPAETLPAPRPGQTLQQPFPPTETASVAPTPIPGPLRVLRYSPEGNVEQAPFLSVTFDQPMAPLTSLAELVTRDVPVILTPQPEGSWHWLGTQTLTFQPTFRFPMATRYQVEIPAGATSLNGGYLEEAVTFAFTTPPPSVVAHYPGEGASQPRAPLLFLSFDQRIDPAAVLRSLQLTVTGQSFSLRLASAEEVAADESVARLAKEAVEGRWVAFRASEQLPYDAEVTLSVGPGTPSAEGPLTTDQAQSFVFHTYGPLVVREQRCGWETECRPLQPWSIIFSNSLDEESFRESMVHITPELPGGKLTVYGDTLQIEGQSKGRTTYTVTLSKDIADRFGQTLGQDKTLTFAVGSAAPMLYTPDASMAVLDPSSKPIYTLYTLNYARLKVTLRAVQPTDWPDYMQYLQDASRGTGKVTPPGRVVVDKTVTVEDTPDALVQTDIDLSSALNDGLGHVLLIVEAEDVATPTPSSSPSAWYSNAPPVLRIWLQVTHLSLDALVDGQHVLAWANALSDGASLPGVELSVWPSKSTQQSGSDGLATLDLPAHVSGDEPYLLARLGNDSAILPSDTSGWGGGWDRNLAQPATRWYVFDDRAMYRPGEEVHVKGWVRQVSLSEGTDVFALPSAGGSVDYRLTDSRDNQLLTGTLLLNALGGFDTHFTLPANMNLGSAYLSLTLRNAGFKGEASHALQVQEFRRPEYEVKASADAGPFFVDGFANATVVATYYAGGGLPNADVTWNVTSQKGSFQPPNWDDFTFGIWEPWWRMGSVWGRFTRSDVRVETFQGQTDAAGQHTLRIDFSPNDPPQPTSVTAQATVMDVNRQAWAASTNILVHPAAWYVGLRLERTFVERDKPILVDAIVTDLDGKPVSDRPIEMRLVRLDWSYKQGEWVQEELDEQTCSVGSAGKPVRCPFQPKQGGEHRLTATITDAQGRRNLTQVTIWVSGGAQPRSNKVEQESVDLIPDRQEYQPGDTAEILVQSPFVPAEGLLTLAREGIIRTERFHMTESSYTLRVPINEAYLSNLNVRVDLVGSAQRLDDLGQPVAGAPARPAYASGELNLSIPPRQRTLNVQVTPDAAELEPGGHTTVQVRVLDAAGQPAAHAEVALVVVDEAVLALTNYQLADPIAAFYVQRGDGVSDEHTRGYVLLVDPAKLAEQAHQSATLMRTMAVPAPTTAPAYAEGKMAFSADESAAEQAAIRVRTNFDPLAIFQAAVATDATGRVSVPVTLPDNLTRYRIMAVAVLGERQFGKGESTLTARLPLMVRASPPRFLNLGDRFELPIVLQNQTDASLQVDVALQASNIALEGAAGQRLTVPARDRREVRFVCSTVSAGTARFQVGAVAGQWADASEFSLPVYTPATTEAFAVYGVLDQGALAQPVLAPTGVFTQYGGLEISTSSTALQALSDAVLYLTSYPYECSEQIASRVLAVAALRDVLGAFKAEGLPSSAEMESSVQSDIEMLANLQNSDGGWSVWRKAVDSWPFHSIHAVHALLRAKQKGFTVPAETLSAGLSYLRNIEQHFPAWYSEDCRNTLLAYALYVRTLGGDTDLAVRARTLVDEQGVQKLQPEALGWLLYVMSGDARASSEVEQVRRYLGNRVVETAGAAHFTTSYREEDGYLLLDSNRRADGVILEALIRDQPQSDLIPKLVKGLMAQRKAGRWGNTQENVFILLALDQYFRTYEAQTPDFVARVWLGEQYVAGFTFQGRSTDYQTVNVPMSYLTQSTAQQSLILSKEGTGRLYYRLGLRYAPTNLQLKPAEEGFSVLREYVGVDDPADVQRDADGVWHIKAGARVRVNLTLVAPTRRYHVALTDSLPAGLEPQNPELAVTGSIPQDPSTQQREPYWWWHWTWYEHQNMRDQRVEAFASLLWEGVHTYSYVARATTPGQFVAPPAKAEEMYSPEVFGRTASERVVVE